MASTAEATPPTTATAAANGSAPSTAAVTAPAGVDQQAPARGIPYYEKLRRELRDTLQKKRLMDKNMAALEESIYRFEQSYLEETGAGNIIKGFDNYIKGASSLSSIGGSGIGASFGSGNGPTTRRKGQVADSDRVFSRSSASFMRDSPAPSSAHTTPSHAQTPTSTGPGYKGTESKDTLAGGGNKAALNKKSNRKSVGDASSSRRDREAGDEGDNKQPLKRLKITYVRGD
ncbi:chromatin modification-related protein eaf6 [Microsporum audouinii]